MFKAAVFIYLGVATALVPCVLANDATRTDAALTPLRAAPGGPSPCAPPGGPSFFPPPMGCAPGGALMPPGPVDGRMMPPPPGPGGGPPMPYMLPMMMPGMAGLTMSDQQVESIAALQRSFRTVAEPTKSKMHQLEDALQQQLVQDSIDTARVKQLQEELQEQHNLLDKAAGEHMVQMAQALTPEQRKKLRQQLDRMTLSPAMMHLPGQP